MLALIATFLTSVLVTSFILMPVVWWLKVFKIGQYIREEGPEKHRLKAGTPTMGGIGILISILIFSIILLNVEMDIRILGVLILMVGFALLGAIDDGLKIVRRKNCGLTPLQKIILQVIISSAFGFLILYTSNQGRIPSFLYLPFIVLTIVGCANAVNLTDGLDGLASGSLFLSFLAFGIIAFKLQSMEGAMLSLVASGATLAFLRHNFYPADVFLGDVGSLSLGALLSGIAIFLHRELLLIIIGFVFVIEAASVIAQVASYKIWGKRILMMSPLHHHFELLGFREPVIVIAFLILGAIFGGLGIWFS